jgi:hypothetical protein
MAELVDNSIVLPIHAMSNGAIFDAPRAAGARSSRRVS